MRAAGGGKHEGKRGAREGSTFGALGHRDLMLGSLGSFFSPPAPALPALPPLPPAEPFFAALAGCFLADEPPPFHTRDGWEGRASGMNGRQKDCG